MVMKKIVGGDVLISYYNFSEEFTIHTYANNAQPGVVSRQNGNSVSVYSHRLTLEQTNYTTTES